MKVKFVNIMGCVVLANSVNAATSIVGDIVARDLSGAGPLGHIGVLSAPTVHMRPTVVLEALDTSPHIQENPISDFKSRTKYWGSKGGLLSPSSKESWAVANAIVRQYFACPEYTITWRWKEGTIDGNTRPITCGQFRCDTLVNFAYSKAERILPTYNTMTTTPLGIWNFFPVVTDTFMAVDAVNKADWITAGNDSDIGSINEDNIKELNEQDFYNMLQNSSNISKEQIEHLWALITSNEVDSKVRILFYDFISFEDPYYLTNEIIKQAKIEKGVARHKLLVALQSIYQSSLEKKKESRIRPIIHYFQELQSQNLDKNDGGIVYRGLATLSPKHLMTNKANLTNMDKIHVDVLSIKSDKANEKKYIRDIISNLDNPDDNLVVTASYQYLTQLLISSDLNIFSAEGKALFKKHLDKKNMINNKQSMLYTSAYLEFKAALNASKVEDIPALAYDYVQTLEPKIQESTYFGFSDFTKKK